MSVWLWTLLALPVGLAVGRLHFRALRSGTEALIHGGSAARALALTALRFGLSIGCLIGAALLGAGPLLAAALGIALGRAWELRLARAEAEAAP